MSTNDERDRAILDADEAVEALARVLKRNDVVAALTERGVNTSLALTVVFGLEAYLHGDKVAAIDELATALEEISRRASVPE